MDSPLRERFAWRPQPKQAELLKAAGLLDWFLRDRPVTAPAAGLLGYGGAAGGGKTDTLLAVGLMICDAFPGAKVGFFRRTYEELDGADGAIQRSLEIYAGLGTYNVSKHAWRFPNGSRLFFRHLHTDKDKYKYQGQQFHVLLVDEATHFIWSMVDYLLTRNRTTIAGLFPFCVMASNPGNVGHVWYSELFDVQDHSGGRLGAHYQVKTVTTANGKGDRVYFVPALLDDNQVLRDADPDYERKLEMRDPDLAEALRWGNWQTFAGQVFKRWRRARNVVPPAMPPANWPKWRAVDWGYAKPFACVWMTMNPDTGRVFVYREVYGPGYDDRQQARTIKTMTPPDETISITYADPSMWAAKNYKGVVYSTADQYQEEGVPLTPADNDRLSGKRKVDRVMADLPDGAPGLIVTENCSNLIRTLPYLVYDRANVEDVDTTQEDHAYDALRYGLTNYRIIADEKKGREASGLERIGRLL